MTTTTADVWAAAIHLAAAGHQTEITLCASEAEAREAIRGYLTIVWRARGHEGEPPADLRDVLAATDYHPVDGWSISKCRVGLPSEDTKQAA